MNNSVRLNYITNPNGYWSFKRFSNKQKYSKKLVVQYLTEAQIEIDSNLAKAHQLKKEFDDLKTKHSELEKAASELALFYFLNKKTEVKA